MTIVQHIFNKEGCQKGIERDQYTTWGEIKEYNGKSKFLKVTQFSMICVIQV
jgi:hypothetical protein